MNSPKLQGSFYLKSLLSCTMVGPAVVCTNVNVSFQAEQPVMWRDFSNHDKWGYTWRLAHQAGYAIWQLLSHWTPLLYLDTEAINILPRRTSKRASQKLSIHNPLEMNLTRLTYFITFCSMIAFETPNLLLLGFQGRDLPVTMQGQVKDSTFIRWTMFWHIERRLDSYLFGRISNNDRCWGLWYLWPK